MSLQKEYEAYLSHYGVPGMKWGVRKEVERKQRKKRREIKKERRSAAKNRSLLSSKNLDQRIKRLEREKKLKDLTDSELNRGKTKTRDVLEEVGKKTAITLLTGATIGGTYFALSKIFGGSGSAATPLDFIMKGAR